MRTDRQMDGHDEANSRFSQFYDGYKNLRRNTKYYDICIYIHYPIFLKEFLKILK